MHIFLARGAPAAPHAPLTVPSVAPARVVRFALTKAVLVAYMMTFFSFFDIPVFWPILLLYFCVLFALTMKRQILHMRKHNYVPWACGKKSHKDSKKVARAEGAPQAQPLAPPPPPAGLKKINRPM